MNAAEVRQLADFCRANAESDSRTGRRAGVVDWMIVDLALQTGLRCEELRRIRMGDLDLDRCYMRPRRCKKRGTGDVPAGTLALSDSLIAHLREFLAWKGGRGEPMGPADFLLCGKRGAFSTRGLAYAWQRCVGRAGLPDDYGNIHTARHTVGTNLFARTKDPKVVQEQLGHSRMATTMDMYVHANFDDMRKGVNGMYDD